MLRIQGLSASVGGRALFEGLDLTVHEGEAVVLFGPNGSGKTTLLKIIMGLPGYEISEGSITFQGRDITGLKAHERAALGIGLGFQRPVAVRGVKLGTLISKVLEKQSIAAGSINARDKSDTKSLARTLALEGFLDRDLNLGFSGGEAKRSELLQLLAQGPDFVMFDEPDSGVDMESVSLVGNVMNRLLEKDRPQAARAKAGIIVTHAGYILDYVNADRAYVMMEGKVLCSGNPRDLLEDIRSRGYKGCGKCAS